MIKWVDILSAGKMNTGRKSAFKSDFVFAPQFRDFGKNGELIWLFGIRKIK